MSAPASRRRLACNIAVSIAGDIFRSPVFACFDASSSVRPKMPILTPSFSIILLSKNPDMGLFILSRRFAASRIEFISRIRVRKIFSPKSNS